MESGSLLADALRYMQQVHQNERSLPFDVLDENGVNENGAAWQGCESNSITFSLFCLDPQFQPFYSRSGESKNLKELQKRLAFIHTIIHGKLKPLYEKRYDHTWFSGGEGISFGMHCCGNSWHSQSGRDEEITDQCLVPHLRATVKYGPHPIDEQYALSIILNLSRDLYTQYQINTAVSCWDVDDGQILLIEGADCIPDWIDDVIGVEGMVNRVYIVNGTIQILDPSIKSNTKDTSTVESDRSIYNITLRESLHAITSKIEDEIDIETLELNGMIKNRLNPFLEVTNKTMDLKAKRKVLKEHVHTAAVVLPLRIALLIQHRTDLISCAILQFCSKAPDKLGKRKNKKSSQTPSENYGGEGNQTIQYENLVFTTITMSKSLYAMLLTAAGQIPPPIKIPKKYKSVELNRMKRQCLLGGEGYAHFRHAIEIGLRLTLGFEWIMNEKGNTTCVDNQMDMQNDHPSSIETRISHHCRIDKEAGGDGGKWIQAAWAAGPNCISDENDISNIVKCPVYSEISKGGICPLKHCGTSVSAHVKNTLRDVEKKDLDAINTAECFPFPRMDDVDSDSWIDMNSIDDLEAKMCEMTGEPKKYRESKRKQSRSIETDNDFKEMNKMMNGLDSFVKDESELEGIVTKNGEKNDSNQSHFDLNKISPKIFLTMMHKVLKADSLEDINDFSEVNEKLSSNEVDGELLQYFTRDDLNLIGSTSYYDDTKQNDPTSMKDLMSAMDQELLDEDLDRTCKVPSAEHMEDNADENSAELPFDDPTAIKSNVISNLLESLDAQDGKSGPVSNILNEMGIKPPGEQ